MKGPPFAAAPPRRQQCLIEAGIRAKNDARQLTYYGASRADDSSAASSAPWSSLQAAINHFIAMTNHDPKPFIWTADPDKIIATVDRARQALDSIH